MAALDWKVRYKDRLGDARKAVQLIKPGNSIFVGTGCAQPQHLVDALVEHGKGTIRMMLRGPVAGAVEARMYRAPVRIGPETVIDQVLVPVGTGFG